MSDQKYINLIKKRQRTLDNMRERASNQSRLVNDAVNKIRKQHGNTIKYKSGDYFYYDLDVCYFKWCDFDIEVGNMVDEVYKDDLGNWIV